MGCEVNVVPDQAMLKQVCRDPGLALVGCSCLCATALREIAMDHQVEGV